MMSDVEFRPLAADEMQLFQRFAVPSASGVGERSPSYEDEVASGGYREGWVWVALRERQVVARAAFWGPGDSDHPYTLDRFDVSPDPTGIEIGARLLRRAYAGIVSPDYAAPPHPVTERPDYHLMLPADWQDRPDAAAAAQARIDAASAAGLTYSRERINVRWTPEDGLPARSDRLTFTRADDDQSMIDVLARILVDSLDVADGEDRVRYGGLEAARRGLEVVAGMPGGRDRWRLAWDRDGELVGAVLPTRNPSSATIGYLGVVPEHRGNGYAVDLVAEALHLFAEDGEPMVSDATDAQNVPMQDAFARARYRVTGRRIIFV